jgi:hypothetical protein
MFGGDADHFARRAAGPLSFTQDRACRSRTIPSGVICAGLASASKKSVLASEQDRPDVARRRVRWKRYQGAVDPQHLVFIDGEPANATGSREQANRTKTNMAPLRGWGKRGHRVQAKAPFGHWNTMTFLAALRHDRIDAPWVFDGPINADIFRTYVEKVLVPTLRPRDIVILDNLGSHKAPAIRQAIRAAGARLWFRCSGKTRHWRLF